MKLTDTQIERIKLSLPGLAMSLPLFTPPDFSQDD